MTKKSSLFTNFIGIFSKQSFTDNRMGKSWNQPTEFRQSFQTANWWIPRVSLISSGTINVSPILTDTFPMEEVLTATKAATDRSRSVKVQLTFDD